LDTDIDEKYVKPQPAAAISRRQISTTVPRRSVAGADAAAEPRLERRRCCGIPAADNKQYSNARTNDNGRASNPAVRK